MKLLGLIPRVLKLARQYLKRLPKRQRGRERKGLFDKIRERFRDRGEEDTRTEEVDVNELTTDVKEDDFDVKKVLIPLAIAGIGVGAMAYAGSTGSPISWGENNKNTRFRRTSTGEKLSDEEIEQMNASTHQRKYANATASVYDIVDTDQISYKFSKKYQGESQGSGTALNNIMNIRYGKSREGLTEIVTEKKKTHKDANGNVVYDRDESGNYIIEDRSIGKFSIYSDVAYNLSDFSDLIYTDRNYRNLNNGNLPTMSQFIHKYAPSGDSNDPDKYVRNIEQMYGIKPDDILDFKNNKEQFVGIVKAVALIENNVKIDKGYLERVWEWKYNNGEFPHQTRNGQRYSQKKVLEDASAEGETVPQPTPDVETEPASKVDEIIEKVKAVKQSVNIEPLKAIGLEVTDIHIPTVIRKVRNINTSNMTTEQIVVHNYNPNGV